MGRLFVVFLATLLTMAIAIAMIPSMVHTAFHVADHGVPWFLLVGGVIFYGYHRLTGK